MKYLFLIIALAIMSSGTVFAKSSVEYFPDEKFKKDTPLPESILGFNIGEWHATPEAITYYLKALAVKSPNVSYEVIGRSHEQRAISHIYISSPENIANLEKVRQRHITATSSVDDILIVNLSYSVHGDEASGANTSPLIAYYLAASKDPWVKKFLSKTVVIIEPVQNPDGLTRFAAWVNSNKGRKENFDEVNREHHSGWPSGRTNHYWFDINRDWIFLVHPESRAKIKEFRKWRPHVLGDYHEMGGSNTSFFFQPGHSKRIHPHTLPENQDITMGLAKFHAKALDERRQPFYTAERFDDFYYGKGSAYPDATGSIGLLFEQTSVRGHARRLGGTKIRFSDAIANQLATSISLLRGSDALREKILDYRFSYQIQQAKKAAEDKIKGYIFSDDGDKARARILIDILLSHEIPVYELSKEITHNDQLFESGHSWVVPLNSGQYALIKSLFERQKNFSDNVFYDVSTWNLALSLNLPYSDLKSLKKVMGKQLLRADDIIHGGFGLALDESSAAYAIPWNQNNAPHLLQNLLENKILPRVATMGFTARLTNGKNFTFDRGTIVIQPTSDEQDTLTRAILGRTENMLKYGLDSALTPKGPDLGSRDMKVLMPVKAALVVGPGVTVTEAGEIRHALDLRFGIPVTLLDIGRVNSTDLNAFTHILLANGSYKGLDKSKKSLLDWVSAGGVLVAQKGGAIWAEKLVISADVPDKEEPSKSAITFEQRKPYQSYQADVGEQTIPGSILSTDVDLSHPFMFGLKRKTLPVFYKAKDILRAPTVSYDMPLAFEAEPLLSGFASAEAIKKIAKTPALAIHRKGKGMIVTIANNMLFRGIWASTEKIYANILFFSQAVEKRKNLTTNKSK